MPAGKLLPDSIKGDSNICTLALKDPSSGPHEFGQRVSMNGRPIYNKNCNSNDISQSL